MAGIDRRIAGGEQRQQRRLRPLQVEGDLEVAVGRDVGNLVIPGLARVLAEFLRRLAHQHVEGAFDVIGRKRLAVVPLYALPQLEIEYLFVIAPGPALREIRDDRFQAVLRNVLLVDDQVVEDGHEGNVDRIGRLLMDRGAGRTVPVIDPQDAALLLLAGLRKTGNHQQRQCRGGTRLHAPHASLPRYFGLSSARFSRTISWRKACATSDNRSRHWSFGLRQPEGVARRTIETEIEGGGEHGRESGQGSNLPLAFGLGITGPAGARDPGPQSAREATTPLRPPYPSAVS